MYFVGNKTNVVHCLDLERMQWLNVVNQTNTNGGTYSNNGAEATSNGHLNESNTSTFRQIDGFRPEPRYGHSQITLDEERVLIVGGCGGPNKQYDDVWILNWPRDMTRNASWQKITVENFINSPVQSYCIPFVQCESKLVMFGKPRCATNTTATAALTSENGNGVQYNPAPSIPFMSAGAAMASYEFMSAPALTIATFQKASVVPRKCSCFSMQQQKHKQVERKSDAFLTPTSSSKLTFFSNRNY
jgi:hypothetical protein